MLIYNFQKEFLGIDAKELQELGYHDLSSLQSEVTDFADLFVKTPGYVHNFQHVHWIDFISCADDGEIYKVIINANGKNFTANLLINYAYLSDNPTEKAYLIDLNNLRVLSENEVENIHDDILQKQTPIYQKTKSISMPEVEIEDTPLSNPVPNIIPQEDKTIESIDTFVPKTQEVLEDIDTDDIKIDIDLDEEPIEEVTTPSQTEQKETFKKEKFDNGYIYDPEVASKELGLPLDLVEEFIQDFIAQAKSFKAELYNSLNDGDIGNVKSLSHMLKGVAANLRVEDAFEVLTIINTTSDIAVIQPNLDLFYKIIAKLAGEEIAVVDTAATQQTKVESIEAPVENDKSDDFRLDFKDDAAIAIEEPTVIQEEKEQQEDISLDFKDDAAIAIEEPTVIQEEKEQQENISLDFKDDAAIAIEEPTVIQEEEKEIVPEIIQESIDISYSPEKIANEIGIDIESFKELFNDYIDESNIVVKEMQNACKNNNFEIVGFEAMKLKGMSENMRVASFNDELAILLNTTNQEESLKHIHRIENILTKLSKVGAY